jgi:hypothetical protein
MTIQENSCERAEQLIQRLLIEAKLGLKETVKKDNTGIAEGDGKVWLENSL